MSKKEFWDEGYLLLKSFFDKDIIDGIRNEAKSIYIKQFINQGLITDASEIVTEIDFEDKLKELFDNHFEIFLYCGKQCQHLISLHKLSLDNKLINLLKDLGIQTPIISTRPVLFTNSAKIAKNEINHTVPPHQDWASMQGSANSLIVWIPLMDVPSELGPVEVIPGSHKNGLVSTKKVNSFGVIENVEGFEGNAVEIGDIVVFSSFLIHKSGTNSSNMIRWSCHFRYNDLDDKSFIERGYPHAYIYRPIDDYIDPDFDSKSAVEEIINNVTL